MNITPISTAENDIAVKVIEIIGEADFIIETTEYDRLGGLPGFRKEYGFAMEDVGYIENSTRTRQEMDELPEWGNL